MGPVAALLLAAWMAAHAAEPVLPVLEALPAPAVPDDSAPWPEDGVIEVILDVSVDAAGSVVSAGARDPNTPEAFARAAVDAALSARFTPARDAEGQPAPATIGLAVRLVRDQAAPRSVTGLVRQAGTRVPLDNVRVEATSADGTTRVATTDDAGRFSFAGLPPGPTLIAAQGPALRREEAAVTVREDAVQDVVLSLVQDSALAADNVGTELVVEGRRATPEVTERVLSAELARVLPGTNGDVVKVVQSLPGVSRAPLGTGNLIIRGTAPEDSGSFLDGTPLPIVFHFAGLTTVLASDAVAEVVYLPSNASVRYGRILGGLIDIRTTNELPERNRRVLGVDLYQSSLYVDQKIGERGVLSISGRRSYIDTIAQPILDAQQAPVQAPRFWDIQARALHVADSGRVSELLVLTSSDEFRLLGDDGDSDEPLFALSIDFWRARGRVVHPVGGGFTHESVVSIGVDTEDFAQAGDDTATETLSTIAVRDEWQRPATPDQLGTRLGIDLLAGRDLFLYDVANFGPFEGGSTPYIAPAAYAELSAMWGPVTLTPGVRGDLALLPYDYIGGSLDPRGSVRWRLDDAWTLSAATGTYSRLPSARQVISSSDGNPTLVAERSWQSALGLEFQPRGDLSIETTAFGNRIDRRVVGREDRFRFFTGPPPSGPLDDGPYENDGLAVIYGAEFLARVDRPRTTAWLAATLSRSLRRDRPSDDLVPFIYDQPLVLTAVWTTLLPKNWRLGARYRFTSGTPYTPVVNRLQDLENNVFIPVYGENGSERLPVFTALDLRVDKTYTFDAWTLTCSVDLQNLAPRPNPEVAGYNGDFTELQPITGLPPLPVFGFRAEW